MKGQTVTDITYQRGTAKPEDIIALRDAAAGKIKALGDKPDKWTPEQVEDMRSALAAFHDGLEEVFVKVVNGYKRGDVIALADQTVGKITGFVEDNKIILFKRNNGSTGRAAVDYIKEKRA